MSEVNHGIIRPVQSLKNKDLERVRSRVRVGDKFRCPRMVKDSNGDLVERWEKVTVTKKYPHLVTVSSLGGREYPVRTITYLDILTDSRFTANL